MFSKVLSRHPFIDPFLKKPIFLRTARGSWRIFSVTEYCPSTLTIQLQRNVVRWVGSIRMPKTGMGWNWSAFFLLGYTKSKTPLITPVIWTHADTQLDTLNTSCEPNIPIISHWRDSVQSRAFVRKCYAASPEKISSLVFMHLRPDPWNQHSKSNSTERLPLLWDMALGCLQSGPIARTEESIF